MNYKIDNSDLNNIKIVALSDIESNTTVGEWVTLEPQSDESRHLYQKENMTEPWHESDDLGRYANHSNNPNTRVELVDNSIKMISNKNIVEGEEIFVDYNTLTELIGYIPHTDF